MHDLLSSHCKMCMVADVKFVQLWVYWASGEIQKTTNSFVYEQSKTLRTRSADLIIGVNTPKASGLSPALRLSSCIRLGFHRRGFKPHGRFKEWCAVTAPIENRIYGKPA